MFHLLSSAQGGPASGWKNKLRFIVAFVLLMLCVLLLFFLVTRMLVDKSASASALGLRRDKQEVAGEKIGGEDDGIAVRVMPNNKYYSPSRWYLEQELTGSPSALLVDGYQAVRDGRTVYVSAANIVEGASTDIMYVNMYIISHTQNANSDTTDIFGQLLNNWGFNTNINEPEMKAKIVRDVRRLADLREIQMALENASKYPELAAGSYVANKSISVWPSWQETLGQKLGITIPVDPLNKLTDCDDPIRADGKRDGTCWHDDEKRFGDLEADGITLKHSIPDKLPGHVYAYVYNSDGTYKICAVMEAVDNSNLPLSEASDWVCAGSAVGIQLAAGENKPPIVKAPKIITIAGGQSLDEYIYAYDPDGRIRSWEVLENGTPSSWASLTAKPTRLENYRRLYRKSVSEDKTLKIKVVDNGGKSSETEEIKVEIAVAPVCSDDDATCDAVDDDCDGETDEDYVETSTTCGTGACEANGLLQCVDGSEVDSCVEGTPGTEVCDGIDNDCDDNTADGSGETWFDDACDGNDSDLCNEGYYNCSGGVQVCTDTTGDNAEVCGNGIDEDCDGSDLECPPEECIGGTSVGECATPPWYCETAGNALVENCGVCGCSNEWICPDPLGTSCVEPCIECNDSSLVDVLAGFCGQRSDINDSCGGTMPCTGTLVCPDCGSFKDAECISNSCGGCASTCSDNSNCDTNAMCIFDTQSSDKICTSNIPKIISFDVTPSKSAEGFTISWAVAEGEEFRIAHFELWRSADGGVSWIRIGEDINSGGRNINDDPTDNGTYKYGLHIINSDNTAYTTEETWELGPIEVEDVECIEGGDCDSGVCKADNTCELPPSPPPSPPSTCDPDTCEDKDLSGFCGTRGFDDGCEGTISCEGTQVCNPDSWCDDWGNWQCQSYDTGRRREKTCYESGCVAGECNPSYTVDSGLDICTTCTLTGYHCEGVSSYKDEDCEGGCISGECLSNSWSRSIEVRNCAFWGEECNSTTGQCE